MQVRPYVDAKISLPEIVTSAASFTDTVFHGGKTSGNLIRSRWPNWSYSGCRSVATERIYDRILGIQKEELQGLMHDIPIYISFVASQD